MAQFNKHFITGRVGNKAELRFLPSGKEVASFRLCRQPRRLNQQTQQWEDGDEQWFDVTCFGRIANNVVDSLDKGYTVTVLGELKVGTYTTRNGETRTKVEIVADDVLVSLDHQIIQMVDRAAYGNKTSGGTGAPANNGYNRNNNYNNAPAGGYNNDGGDDAPF